MGIRSNYSYDQEIFHRKVFLDALKSVLQLGSKLLLPLRSNPALHSHISAAPTLYPVLSTGVSEAAQLGRSRW